MECGVDAVVHKVRLDRITSRSDLIIAALYVRESNASKCSHWVGEIAS